MATIKFLVQSKKENASIYVRLSIDRSNVFKRKTNFIINPYFWSSAKGLPITNSGDEDIKILKTNLKEFALELEKRYNNSTKKGTLINGDWLQTQINEIQNKKEENDLDSLVNYFQYFIDNLPYREKQGNKQGASEATVKKYKTLKNKIVDFEKYRKKRYRVKDVGMRFRNDLIQYFTEIDKLASSSIGRYVKYVKTVCLDAKLNEIETHPQLEMIKGFTVKHDNPYLSFEELKKIELTTYKRKALENAKDWLLIGCFIGQRVSDLLDLKADNIQEMSGYKMIVLTQKKTGKEVAIPIHDKIKPILEKRNWHFPESISAQKFNDHIKNVTQIAGLKDVIEGGKMICEDEKANPKVYRKVFGSYQKWELTSSHICRRSFATNFYADTPTALLINITAHSTEKQFLEYIGKPAKDFSVQLAEYWKKEALKARKEPVLSIKRKVN